MAQKHKETRTFWLPYPSLLKGLGFYSTDQSTWKRKVEGEPMQIIHWFKIDGVNYLQLSETWSGVFVGEVQSEAEFLTLLRQVRWDGGTPAAPATPATRGEGDNG